MAFLAVRQNRRSHTSLAVGQTFEAATPASSSAAGMNRDRGEWHR